MDFDISAPFWQTAFGLLLFSLLLLACVYWLYWRTHLKGQRSPFSGRRLGRGDEILYPSAEKIYAFLSSFDLLNIPTLDLSKACFCKETGRIFPDAINRIGEIDLEKNYLRKYFSGKLVPWFRLSKEQQEKCAALHSNLKGFQLGKSLKPGPLFVDLKSWTLVGWQQVTGTEMEILIVQKPTQLKE